MSKVELSLWIETNFPANSKSAAMRKTVYGVGINDAPHVIEIRQNGNRITEPCHTSWWSMLRRAYDSKFHSKQPTYIDVTVCPEWLMYSGYRKWWLENHTDGFALDKDLLHPGNTVYSPDTCIYIPQWLNSFTIDSGATRGEWPIGVHFNKRAGKFQAYCNNRAIGKLQHLGFFSNPESAHMAWKQYKLELADELKPRMDSIDKRIYPNVVTIIKAAQ